MRKSRYIIDYLIHEVPKHKWADVVEDEMRNGVDLYELSNQAAYLSLEAGELSEFIKAMATDFDPVFSWVTARKMRRALRKILGFQHP